MFSSSPWVGYLSTLKTLRKAIRTFENILKRRSPQGMVFSSTPPILFYLFPHSHILVSSLLSWVSFNHLVSVTLFSTGVRAAPFVPPPDFNPELDSNYHYVPTGWVCLIFISLYGLSACTSMMPPFPCHDSFTDLALQPRSVVHLVEATYFRMWFLLPTAVLAGIGEVLGWTGRYWSSLNDGILNTPFLIQ